MKLRFALAFAFCFLFGLCARAESALPKSEGAAVAYAVKIEGEISAPQLAILKRAIREANAAGAKFLILDMDTPGGDLGTTLEIMKVLPNFKGQTVCYVNPDAVSAGSFIAVACDKIYFAPNGVMGAAEAVLATGKDVDESMQRKITSYLSAKVRVASGANERRAEVQRAMNDPNYELKIGGKVFKKKGELLSLTAKEASEIIGGAPVLADGVAKNMGELLKRLSPDSAPVLTDVKITWADAAAKYISSVSPLLIGAGLLLIFLEIKSGSFGFLGALGVCALAIAFLGARLSGAAGHEAEIAFVIGVALIAFEVFVFPGLIFPALIGGLLVLGSLVWTLADIWPERGFEYNLDGVYIGIQKVGLGIFIAFAAAFVIGKFLPSTPLWGRLVLNRTSVSKNSRASAVSSSDDCGALEIGARGVCVSDLMPSGQVRAGGRVVDAQSAFGHLSKGDEVEIIAKNDFNYMVRKVSQ